jgi:hypothetical protein
MLGDTVAVTTTVPGSVIAPVGSTVNQDALVEATNFVDAPETVTERVAENVFPVVAPGNTLTVPKAIEVGDTAADAVATVARRTTTHITNRFNKDVLRMDPSSATNITKQY